MSRKGFIKTLELIKKDQCRTQASLFYLRNDGAKVYKRKCCKAFYAKMESAIRLPRDTEFNQMD
jgi:hypothetical protein